MKKSEKILTLTNQFHNEVIAFTKPSNKIDIFKSPTKIAAAPLLAAFELGKILLSAYGTSFLVSMGINTTIESIKDKRLPKIAYKVYGQISSIQNEINSLPDQAFYKGAKNKMLRILESLKNSIDNSASAYEKLSSMPSNDPRIFYFLDNYMNAVQQIESVDTDFLSSLDVTSQQFSKVKIQKILSTWGVGFEERGEIFPDSQIGVPDLYGFLNIDFFELKTQLSAYRFSISDDYNKLVKQLEAQKNVLDMQKAREVERLVEQQGGEAREYKDITESMPTEMKRMPVIWTEHGFVRRPKDILEQSSEAVHVQELQSQWDKRQKEQLEQEKMMFRGKNPLSEKMEKMKPQSPETISVSEGNVYRHDPSGKTYLVSKKPSEQNAEKAQVIPAEKLLAPKLKGVKIPNLMERLQQPPAKSVQPSKSNQSSTKQEDSLQDLAF